MTSLVEWGTCGAIIECTLGSSYVVLRFLSVTCIKTENIPSESLASDVTSNNPYCCVHFSLSRPLGGKNRVKKITYL